MNNKKNFSWMNEKIEVRNTQECGKGVFAKKNIKKDETLAIFGGYILSLEEESLLEESFKDGGLQIDENYVISSMDHVESTDFFNHSCEPNAGFNGQISLVSMKDINKDEEIRFDYSMCLFSKNKKSMYSFSCKCGNKNCRNNVTSDDWKNKQLQDKYRGYFQKFLEDKFN